MIGSTLTVHVIDVRGLGKVNGRTDPRIIIYLKSENGNDGNLN